jgi:heptosyltransferase-2
MMKFLVIQTRDIGDVMLSTALCNTLKKNNPNSVVDMLTMDHCTGVIEGNPFIDEIIILKKSQRKNVTYILKLLRSIRARKYHVILNVQGQITGLLTCLFTRSSRRIGFNKFPWSLGHTDNIVFRNYGEFSGYGYTIDDRFALLEPLSLKIEDRSYRIWLSNSELRKARDTLNAKKIDLNRPIVALGINSRDDYKQWPLGHFSEIAKWLIRQFNAQILVFFGPGEEHYSRRLKPLLPESEQRSVFDNLHTHSIRELATIFAHCQLYVGNDTGPRHIAQALDIPAFAIVSPASNKLAWIPWENPRFIAVDSGDALGLSRSEWESITAKLTPGTDDAEWFSKLTPDYVRKQLTKMIRTLDLF